MPKITITVECDSIEEARRFLAERQPTQVVSVNPLSGGVGATITMQGQNAPNTPEPTSALAAASVAAPVSTPAAVSPPTATISATPASAANPRDVMREAMQFYLARGYAVPDGQALIKATTGVGKLKDVPDNLIPNMIAAFNAAPAKG